MSKDMDVTPFSELELSNFEFVNHNETDFESFKEFSKNLDERYEKREELREAEDREKYLKAWIESTPARFRNANFKKLDLELAKEIQNKLKLRQKGYFIAGPHGSGKTFTAYAIVRKLIAAGVLKPSQVKVITESELLGLATGGFETRPELDALIANDYKLYLFDSLGSKDKFDLTRENPALSNFIESVYNRNAFFIATSYQSLEYYSELLTDSAAAKLKNIVKDGMLYTGEPLDKMSEQKQKKTIKGKNDPYGWEG